MDPIFIYFNRNGFWAVCAVANRKEYSYRGLRKLQGITWVCSLDEGSAFGSGFLATGLISWKLFLKALEVWFMV